MNNIDWKTLVKFYEDVDKKNKEEYASDFPIKILKEDILEEIEDDLKELQQTINKIKSIDVHADLNVLNSNQMFKEQLIMLLGIYGHLNTEFEQLYDLHSQFIKQLPEWTEDAN
ncbi:hypothetical protein [Enterococcus sp. 5H]|uniref:hypothetical protein n=1 Tax=Enterococcus sp. 5H TaxID=1229490 RepID=UPI00230426DD|nr:hypothetical protein [Enterococcus sp. 5H]MDA9470054.1 hypothetical protein [Enterococcus sp. 5H]